jgi:sulfate transporter 4
MDSEKSPPVLVSSSTTSESRSELEAPFHEHPRYSNDNNNSNNNASNRNLSPSHPSSIMTRYRKSLLSIHNDLEAGKSTKHAVPDPSINGGGGGGGSSMYNANNDPASTYAASDAFSAPERWMERHKQSLHGKSCHDWISTLLPMYGWLRTYQWKQFLLTDIIAGLTVGVMVIPQSMSYAKLAGLPVEFGLYSSLVPIYAYAVFGSSRQLAVGPVALVSLLLATGLTTVLDAKGITPENTENYTAIYATMALQTSVLVGFCNIIMGVLKLGFVANFLSHAVISGFTSGAAIIIGFSQVKYFFGYNLPNDKSLHKMLYNIFANISQFNWKTFVLGTSCVLILMGLKKLGQTYPKFKWTRAAGPLFVTVVSIILQATLNLDARGIPIVGYIPQGLPEFTGSQIFPVDFGQLSVVVLTIVIIGFMESIAIAKKLAQTHNYQLDASMELLGLGMANLSSGLFGGYPVTGSFSRSAVNNEAGAQSGVSGMVTATMVAFTLLLLTSIFELLVGLDGTKYRKLFACLCVLLIVLFFLL